MYLIPNNSYRSPQKPEIRNSEMSTLKDAISGMLNHFRLEGKFYETQLVHTWEKVMGKSVSSQTSQIFIRERTLFIELSSASLKQQLNMARTKIKEHLNKISGTAVIDEIVFL